MQNGETMVTTGHPAGYKVSILRALPAGNSLAEETFHTHQYVWDGIWLSTDPDAPNTSPRRDMCQTLGPTDTSNVIQMTVSYADSNEVVLAHQNSDPNIKALAAVA